MNQVTLNIGGLAVLLQGGASVARAMQLPGMTVFRCDDESPQLTIELDVPQQMDDCSVLHRFDVLDGTQECIFGIDADGVYHYSFSGGGTVSINPHEKGIAHCTSMDMMDKLRFALWLSYNMTAASFGRLAIHSSTVVCNGRAVLCLGESGTGKSTHTQLWLKHIEGTHLLNDDSPIISVANCDTDGCARVYGSPWSGKTDCYLQENYPIAALLRLEQRPENTIRRLSAFEAFAALQPSCPPALGHDEGLLDIEVDIIGQVISTTPVFKIGCLPDAAAAHLSHDSIFDPNL